MAYSSNPLLPRARAQAVRLVVEQQLPLSVAARKSGIHRSTLWRWMRRWDALNEHVQLENHNRPTRKPGSAFRLTALRWLIPTQSSRPHTSPRAIGKDVVTRILALRVTLKRCAEVVWHHLVHVEGISVSLSSVRRVLKRFQVVNGRKKRVRPDNPRRPHATRPGELVETDTIHHVDPLSGRRLYYYTVIDLFTRMTHVILALKLSPGLAAQAVLEAQDKWGIAISMAQADNGPEYGRYFAQTLRRHGIATRHTRLHRPNDNAHIERFNRTIQTECIGYFWRRSRTLQHQRDTLTAYLDYYNTKRVHLGIQLQVPAAMLQRF
jgi:transposase InsO family protein